VLIHISLSQQQLCLDREGRQHCFSVSTAVNGAGEQMGSECTPRGAHHVRIKIGDSCPEGTVFVGRRTTGEIYNQKIAEQHPERDWILTRILWLSGDDIGVNRGGEVDTLRRMIYIHGTPEHEPMGVPMSHGCIRMRNSDLVMLFDMVDAGTDVLIED